MKKWLVVLAFLALVGPKPCYANEITLLELFRETENTVIDFAIGSSIEVGYAYDLINGKTLAMFQSPVIYVTPYLTGDFGYITGTERGALMFGGSLRINRLIEDAFHVRVGLAKAYIPNSADNWDKLWFGPWISKRFADFDSSLMAGVKCGVKW